VGEIPDLFLLNFGFYFCYLLFGFFLYYDSFDNLIFGIFLFLVFVGGWPDNIRPS